MNRLACFARDVAHGEPHALEHFADRNETDAHHALADRPKLSLEQFVCLVDVIPRIGRQPPTRLRDRFTEPSPRDHELADHAHQIIESR
jgi:hypothetical protein